MFTKKSEKMHQMATKQQIGFPRSVLHFLAKEMSLN